MQEPVQAETGAPRPAESPTECKELLRRQLLAEESGGSKARRPRPAKSRVLTYDDLPYMGEMTLDNSKPRRGRKPKKADICHLIYENYGTVVPGRPAEPSPPPAAPPARLHLHDRLVSSLLERKLAGAAAAARRDAPDEPLNLCVRDEPRQPAPACLLWPGAGLLLHPVAHLMYYGAAPPVASPAAPQAAPPAAPAPSPDAAGAKLALKHISELLEPAAPDARATALVRKGAVKRKRSAIFIPPVPARHNPTNPTTEVSICKFKFTGGVKPSLQEKKMLSVDSGGNFRYYSGTGAKASRGFEYFQREPSPAVASAPLAPPAPPAPVTRLDETKKKRKSRKSLQREKLEQTFKEKGFLIQTQQLESAEGATYCKFRQLRKFTRYLFRSWKDYLPGNLEADRPPLLAAESSCDDDWS